MSNEDRHYRRRVRFEQGYRQLAAQGVYTKRPYRSRPSAETWVRVTCALLADFISRTFAWLRIVAYLACLGTIWHLGPGAMPVYGMRQVLFDLIFGAYLVHSTWKLLKRECTT